MKKITLRKILGGLLLSIPFVGLFIGLSYDLGIFTTIVVYICFAVVVAMVYTGATLITENKKDKNLSD